MRPLKMVRDSLGRKCPNACYIEKDGMIEFEIDFEGDLDLIKEAAELKNMTVEEYINNALKDMMDDPDLLEKCLEEVKDNE